MYLTWLLDQRDSYIPTKTSNLDPVGLHDPPFFLKTPSLILKESLFPKSASLHHTDISRRKKTRFKYHHGVLKEEQRIEESLPLVMRPIPLLDKCKNEMKIYHRWVGVYFHYSSAYPRPLRVLSLWINIVLMLFIQSLLYDLADPDDGSCEKQETMSDCLRLKSSLSSSPECVWSSDVNNESEVDSSQISEAECSFRSIHRDFDRVLIVAILSGILSSPFSILFQSLILFVLSAKTKSSLSTIATAETANHIGRHSSTKNCTSALSSTLQDDLARLLRKLRLYRNELSPAEREEFECESCDTPLPHPSLIDSWSLQMLGERITITGSTIRRGIPVSKTQFWDSRNSVQTLPALPSRTSYSSSIMFGRSSIEKFTISLIRVSLKSQKRRD